MYTYLRPALVIAFALGLSVGCDKKESPVPTEKPVAVEAPTPTPEPEAPTLNKIVFVLSPGSGTHEGFNAFLQKELGIDTAVVAPGDYKTIVDALRADEAHIAYLPSWPYMVSHHKADMEVILVGQSQGKTEYQSQWLVSAKSPIKTLADLKGKAIAFTAPTSASGFLYPTAALFEASVLTASDDPTVIFKDVQFSGSDKDALHQLTHAKIDAVAVREDAPAKYLTEEEQKSIRVIHSKGPVPADCIAVRNTLPEDVKARIKTALLKLNAPENAQILKDVFGVDALVESQHYQYTETLQNVIETADFPL